MCMCIAGGCKLGSLQCCSGSERYAGAERPTRSQVARVLEEDAAAKVSVKYALVIDGKALLYALSPMLRGLFLQVGKGWVRSRGYPTSFQRSEMRCR